MSMPNSILRSVNKHRLRPKLMWTCTSLLVDLWVDVGLLLPVPLACEPTCRISCMVFLHWPVGPTGSPKSVGRSSCSLGCISSMQI